MSHARLPKTMATRALDNAKASYTGHVFEYVERGGTRHSSQVLGVDEHHVIKTLLFEDEHKQPLVVLMHGDCKVSTKELARQLNTKTIQPCEPTTAERHTGYQVGGTSPFGLKKAMPIYVESSILELPLIYINGGKRGFLVTLAPSELTRILGAKPVTVAISREA